MSDDARNAREFMERELWPFWPYQPIKHKRTRRVATLVDYAEVGKEARIRFVGVNYYDTAAFKAAVVAAVADPLIDAAQLARDGWEID